MITLVKLTKEVTHLSQNRAVRYESTTAVRWPHFAHDKENPSFSFNKLAHKIQFQQRIKLFKVLKRKVINPQFIQ